MRTNVYIDGFNLYYGVLKNTPWRWLDLEALCTRLLRPHHQLGVIKYFTAQIHQHRNNPEQKERQNVYLRALEAHCPKVEIYYGRFQRHEKSARLVNPINGRRDVTVWNTEEKGSDVNLAVHLLNDAWLDVYDCAVVVTNDSDIAGGMELVKKHRNKFLGLVPPIRRKQREPVQQLKQHTNFVRRITPTMLKYSQLPTAIPGTKLRKPERW